MKTNILHDGPRFRIISHGNGLAYQFMHKPAGLEVFFQGDDAMAFENEFNADRDLDDLWADYEEVAQDVIIRL